MKTATIFSLITILTLFACFVIACGDDDDDDDQSGTSCHDEAHDDAQMYCEDYGTNAAPGAGLDYSYAECNIYCSGQEFYYTTDCGDSVCVCCE